MKSIDKDRQNNGFILCDNIQLKSHIIYYEY